MVIKSLQERVLVQQAPTGAISDNNMQVERKAQGAQGLTQELWRVYDPFAASDRRFSKQI